jgi:hypothetical protein
VSDVSSDAIMARLQDLAQSLPAERRLELIEHLTAVGPSERRAVPDTQALEAAHAAYKERHVFTEGQLVRWKPKLRNKQLPEYGQLAIVMNVLDEPVANVVEPSDSPYYHEPLDIVLGVIDGSGDLICFHFDARRFEPAASA